MASFGQRLLSLIQMLSAQMSRALSMLRSVLDLLKKLERATGPSGPLGLNPHAWTGLRESSARDYAQAVNDFYTWAQQNGHWLHYPSEIDRAVVAYAMAVHLSRAKLETLIAALKRGLPGVRRNLLYAG